MTIFQNAGIFIGISVAVGGLGFVVMWRPEGIDYPYTMYSFAHTRRPRTLWVIQEPPGIAGEALFLLCSPARTQKAR